MSHRFDGRVAIVTGAGGGLGYAYAEYLAAHGAKVVVNDLGGDPLGMDQAINKNYAVEAVKKIKAAGGEAIANNSSVAEWNSAKQIIEQAMDTWGQVDIIVNNAGITSPAIFPEIEKEEMEHQHSVHVMGTINTMRAAWPHMLANQYGRIVNVASASVFGFVPQIAYPSMKGAILAMTNNLALVGAEQNININAILPAAFTRMSGMLPDGLFRQKLECEYTPDKLAPVVAYLCHENSDVNGEFFSVGGGKFYRAVFAASEAVVVDDTIKSVEDQMKVVMNDNGPMSVIHDSFDDLEILGFNEDEISMFRDMNATANSHLAGSEVDAVKIDSVDDVWKLTIKSPVGDQFSHLVLSSKGSDLNGHVLNEEHGAQDVMKGKIENGDTLTWNCKITKPVPLTLAYSLQMDADKRLGGSVKGKLMGKVVMDSVVTGELVTGAEADKYKQQSQSAPAPKKGLFGFRK